MADHTATIRWLRDGADFAGNKYSRAHEWEFDGGLKVAASASPDIVPLPYSMAENVDPEEAFIASISSCHMLFYLHMCREAGFVVNSYEDHATGVLETNAQGRKAITRIDLHPSVTYEGAVPTDNEAEHLHHQAHDHCFLANSVTAQITTHLLSDTPKKAGST